MSAHTNVSAAYYAGALDASIKLGYLLPALGGAAFGAGTGMLAAPEGSKITGALTGAAMGAAGAAGGKAIVQGVRKVPVMRANRGLSKAMRDGPPTPEVWQKVRDAETAYTQFAPKHLVGGAMLGGVVGTGAGAVANRAVFGRAPVENWDPYGYSQTY